MSNLDAISASLSDTRTSLEASGFELVVNLSGDTIVVGVHATDEACADCLVPKPMFKRMIADQLNANGLKFGSVRVQYPND